MSAERPLLYLDSSALVKLSVAEHQSAELVAHLPDDAQLASSRVALVEVNRAVKLAEPSGAGAREAKRVLGGCLLIDLSDRLLREAAALSSLELRTLDAIHLATALHVEADELVAYDRRLLAGAESHGLAVSAPGQD